MTMAEAFLAEFEQEARATRRFLERLPEGKLGWKPHEKSMTVGQLANHLATSPSRVLELAQLDEAPMPEFGKPEHQPKTLREVLGAFEETLAQVRKGLPSIPDSRMQGMWRITRDGKEVTAMPRAALLRSVMLNHWYHHRGQLGVYLRMLGAKVPSSYGPSADELPEFMQSQ